MYDTLCPQWKLFIKKEAEKSYFKVLINFVDSAYKSSICYPERQHIFRVFKTSNWENTKVLILGQDPYHGKNQAHGLSFSVNDNIPHPPSLRNIFKELENDIQKPYPQNGNLEHWAKQGILLLNATLTVEKDKAGSHQGKGWEEFTDAVIKELSNKKNHIVFMLWGGYAKKKEKLIDSKKHLILSCGHPSPLSANKGYWFGNKHFSKCNTYLEEKNKAPINW